jgi:hypothetical protein
MNDPRIGERPANPPQQTISGGKIVPGADYVNLGGDYYGRLDLPHHPDTRALVDGLKAQVAKPKRKRKVDDEPSEDV